MTERGLSIRDPGPAALGGLVANLQRGDSFVIVERFGPGEPAGDWYVRVGLREGGGYQVECRDGVAAEHYRASTASAAQAAAALVGWAAGRAGWRAEFEWSRVGHCSTDTRATAPPAG
ncbi:hypothetical protein [Streptomyces sp. TLI_171]|uniref:hypothetical protein n=1 Tax=Streptomyces sp. TLI_171 TaxID=1938859 RepID=UPI000C197F3B|nr:hypothetical protein [Streptomyces sp. TLI_171]